MTLNRLGAYPGNTTGVQCYDPSCVCHKRLAVVDVCDPMSHPWVVVRKLTAPPSGNPRGLGVWGGGRDTTPGFPRRIGIPQVAGQGPALRGAFQPAGNAQDMDPILLKSRKDRRIFQ